MDYIDQQQIEFKAICSNFSLPQDQLSLWTIELIKGGCDGTHFDVWDGLEFSAHINAGNRFVKNCIDEVKK